MSAARRLGWWWVGALLGAGATGCDLLFGVDPLTPAADGASGRDGAGADASSVDAPAECPSGGPRQTESTEAIAEVTVPRNSNGPFGCLDVVNAGAGIGSGGLFRFVHPILPSGSIVGYRITFPFADGDRVECEGGPCLSIEVPGAMNLRLVDSAAPDWTEAGVRWTTPNGSGAWPDGDNTLGAYLTLPVAQVQHAAGAATVFDLADVVGVGSQVDGNDHLEAWLEPALNSPAVAVISAKENALCQPALGQARAVLETVYCLP